MTQVIEHQDPSAQIVRPCGRLRDGWYVTRTADAYTLSRHWPARFDLSAHTTLPPLHAGRLARQIRQDMWRDLRDLRGFSPVVEITVQGGVMQVRAGGRLMAGRAPADAPARLDALLNDPARRARWCRWARIDGGRE